MSGLLAMDLSVTCGTVLYGQGDATREVSQVIQRRPHCSAT
jgi:hypothetical protein